MKPSMHIKVGHYRPTSETPFKWRFTGGPIAAHDCVLTRKFQYLTCKYLLIDPLKIVISFLVYYYTNKDVRGSRIFQYQLRCFAVHTKQLS